MSQLPQSELDRIREYLQAQAAAKSIDDIIERVEDGAGDLHAAAEAIPADSLDVLAPSEESPGEEWTPRQCLAHIIGSNQNVARDILHVALTGELPEREEAPVPDTVPDMLRVHTEALESLYEHVRSADPEANLDTTWKHPMFGQLNWREWLLFLRIHCKDHAGQLNAMRTGV